MTARRLARFDDFIIGGHVDFLNFLTDIDHGRLCAVAGDQLERITDAVQTTGADGQLTITLKVQKKGDRAEVATQLTSKIPAELVSATTFFFGRDGGLTREDPRQLALKNIGDQRVKEHGNGK